MSTVLDKYKNLHEAINLTQFTHGIDTELRSLSDISCALVHSADGESFDSDVVDLIADIVEQIGIIMRANTHLRTLTERLINKTMKRSSNRLLDRALSRLRSLG